MGNGTGIASLLERVVEKTVNGLMMRCASLRFASFCDCEQVGLEFFRATPVAREYRHRACSFAGNVAFK